MPGRGADRDVHRSCGVCRSHGLPPGAAGGARRYRAGV